MKNHNHSNCQHNQNAQSFQKKVEFLESNMRDRALPPEQILSMLPLQQEASILDVGAGTGFLTIPAAQQTNGIVYALDLDERMLQVIETKAKTEHVKNIRLVEGNIESIPLSDNSVDSAIASLVLHEVHSLETALSEIHRVLKINGHILCLEYEKDESSVEGPPLHIRIPAADMEHSLRAAGFEVKKTEVPRESIYITVAKKTENASG